MRTESTVQSSSAPKSTAGDGKPEEAEPETARKHSADPSITKIFQFTASSSDQLSDPAMDEVLRAASKLDLNITDISDTYDTYGDMTSDVKSASSADSTAADASSAAGAEDKERKSSSNTLTKSEAPPLTETRLH